MRGPDFLLVCMQMDNLQSMGLIRNGGIDIVFIVLSKFIWDGEMEMSNRKGDINGKCSGYSDLHGKFSGVGDLHGNCNGGGSLHKYMRVLICLLVMLSCQRRTVWWGLLEVGWCSPEVGKKMGQNRKFVGSLIQGRVMIRCEIRTLKIKIISF